MTNNIESDPTNDGTDELNEIMRKRDELGVFSRSLLSPIKFFILFFLLIEKFITDYITRPRDMNKDEFFMFHALNMIILLWIIVLVLVEPVILLAVMVLLILLGVFKK